MTTASPLIERSPLSMSKAMRENICLWECEMQNLCVSKEDIAVSLEYGDLYKTDLECIENELKQYRNKARKFAVFILVDLCMRELCANEQHGRFYIEQMVKLERLQLFPLKERGRYRLVEEFVYGEQENALYKIKCMDIKFSEKRDLTLFYILLTGKLSKLTMGVFPEAYDLVRDQTRSKSLSYELFYEFAEHLSQRDRLIAELLYFDAPGIEPVLKIKITDLVFENDQIIFSDMTCRFPKHVMFGIRKYLSERTKQDSSLLFVNVRGEMVERTHLIRSFARVSQDTIGLKVTPTLLLQSRIGYEYKLKS